MNAELYTLNRPDEILTPALIYYEDLIRENTEKILKTAGGPQRLWPHVKSHKMTAMVQMQLKMGITRFKCATLAEARMAAQAGAQHVLLAYPLVGPNIGAFISLTLRYPAVQFYALGDDAGCLNALDREAEKQNTEIPYFIDVNMGMNRTGVETGRLYEFTKACMDFARLKFSGFHCYDGQVHTFEPLKRRAEVGGMMEPIASAVTKLDAEGIRVPMLIAGGSPSFPCHVGEPDVFLSPGTVFLWDSGYLESYPDLGLTPAAAVMTRVISHPAEGLFTLDLGCKGIASDPPGSRGVVVGLEHAAALFQSEEHWVYRMDPGFESERPEIGSVFYVIPTHICPTTALYSRALVAKGGEITAKWTVDAGR